MQHRQQHFELLYAFRIVSDHHSYIDPAGEDAYQWMNPFPNRVSSDSKWDTAEQLADKERLRIGDLRLYNWYFHTCRVEVRAKGRIIDGRPELHRQNFHWLLADYFDNRRAWPSVVDRYYFDLERRTLTEVQVYNDIASLDGAFQVESDRLTTDALQHYVDYDGPHHPVDLVRAYQVGFEHLRLTWYSSWRDEYPGVEEYLKVSGLSPYVEWNSYNGLQLVTVGWGGISVERAIAEHTSVDDYKVKQWCAIYKCCQVRVDCDIGETDPGERGPAPYGEESMLEDGRTPPLSEAHHLHQHQHAAFPANAPAWQGPMDQSI